MLFLQSKGPLYYIQAGGWVMWPLLGLLILGLAIAFARIIVLYRAKMKTVEFMQKVRSLLLENKLDDAIALAKDERGTIANIFEAVLLRRAQAGSDEELSKVLENAAIHEIAHLEKGLWLLALISNVAPILGFLGTVVGMIQSFDVLAKEGMNNPAAVASGISVALITTAGGLIVAVAVLPFYNYFTNTIGAIVNEIETASNFLFETLGEVRRMGAKARA